MEENFIDSLYTMTSALVTLRIFRVEYLSKYIESEVNRKLYTIMCSILGLLIFSTCIINVIENTQTVGTYWGFLPKDCTDILSCVGANDSFH